MSTETFSVSDSAIARIKILLAQKNQDELKLRVYIQGGGCSGFQYGFQFDEDTLPDDIVINQDGIAVLVDPLSMQYLEEAQLEFKDDLLGSRFIVNNPNAATTCGCGSSFSI